MTLLMSLFPVWMPDSWIYGALGLWVAGALITFFPPWRKHAQRKDAGR
jgi:hypothetical protein